MQQMLFAFVFPNERVYWEIPIVIYPFITCVATGTFFLSALDHLFKKKSLKPVSNLSLLASLAFVAFASVPLLLHLGHPERAFNIMFTPSATSAMATFGYVYGFYLGLVLMEVWLVFRPQIVDSASAAKGVKRVFYSILALGVKDISEASSRLDKGFIKLVAFLRLPTACILSGYVGFIFGSLKAVPLWSSLLIPVIFLVSAVACGIALIVVLYFVAMKTTRSKMDSQCVRSMSVYLYILLVLSGALQLLLFQTAYTSRPEWRFAFQTLASEFPFSLVGLQLIAGLIVPFLLLSALLLLKITDRLRTTLAVISSVLAVGHVFALLWNLIIGGQLASRTLSGALTFHPRFFGKEGILVSAVLLMCPFFFLYVLTKMFPPFERKRRVAA